MNDKNRHQDEEAVTAMKEAEKDAQKDIAGDIDLTSEDLSEDELLDALAAEADAANVGVAEAENETVDGGDGFSNPLEALAAENTAQEEEIKALNEKVLRTAAEMENLRRRTQKDVADARAFSISNFAREMLSVADNLRRALEHVDEADKEQPGLKTLIEGVEMTERELHKGLEKSGVKKISPEGEKFDPHFHQAMFEVQNPDVPNNTVTQVVQVGYVIGERVLRPAMVGVAKGGPKMAAKNEEKSEG